MQEDTHSERNGPIKKVVIVGGGTSGWMCAAALARLIEHAGVAITLIESDAIGTVGVGEATLPSLLDFNRLLGINEDKFMQATQATFKLGIEFVGWQKAGLRYIHPFGRYGQDVQGIKFHQLWLRVKQHKDSCANAEELVKDINDYNLCAQAALNNRFSRPSGVVGSMLAGVRYAYHLDAGLYARYLRDYSESLGVKRLEGTITHVKQRVDDGFVDAVVLAEGTHVNGDLFIDCSGFRGLLIEETLKAGYQSWAHWLPCDRALAVPAGQSGEALLPYTRATADSAGWRWRIPLQHRTGNGYVYSSDHLTDTCAETELLRHLDGEPLNDPRKLVFKAGHRNKFWVKNCVAIGLAGGFIEPLESTSIHLVQSGIAKLMALFPDKRFSSREIDEYNQVLKKEYEAIRDFIILHYKLNERNDTEFWQRLRDMTIPDSLQHKIELFRHSGRLLNWEAHLFTEDSWLAVMLGQGIRPRSYDPLANSLPLKNTSEYLAYLKNAIAVAIQQLPEHQEFLARSINTGMQTSSDRN